MIAAPDHATLETWILTGCALCAEELEQPATLTIDASGLASMLQIAGRGGTVDTMRAIVQQSPEWAAQHPGVTPLLPAPVPDLTDRGAPDVETLAMWIATASAVYFEQLTRARALTIDPTTLATLLQIAATPPPAGGSVDAMRAAVRASPRWHALHDHVNPSLVPLGERVQIRGAMWTARAPVPWGPRPGQDDNCICIDYFECFAPDVQDTIIAAYGPKSPRGYKSAPMGPLVDPGYHGQLPATDWRANPDVYLDAAQKLEDHGIRVVHFLKPDRGVAGLEWSVDDLERELGPVFRSAKAQRLMATVILGWEPGPKYFYNNAWWVAMVQWMARTFPNALRGIHQVSDCDAPVGQDDDRKGISNGRAWANVAPYLHCWGVQNAGYTDSRNPVPSARFLKDFTDQFNPRVRGSFPDRFTTGGPSGDWPTTSAWQPDEPRPLPGTGIIAFPAEYAAMANYWQNWPEVYSQQLGAAALAAGAVAFLDGGPA